jgi:hypothetical protein
MSLKPFERADWGLGHRFNPGNDRSGTLRAEDCVCRILLVGVYSWRLLSGHGFLSGYCSLALKGFLDKLGSNGVPGQTTETHALGGRLYLDVHYVL